ncbi:MAG: S9 family peptidase [Bacteroidales bacterium]|nr:S9 family peptidase [Candidatus Equimonas enterica]
MIKSILIAAAMALTITTATAQTFIGPQKPQTQSDIMTPEDLWAMGRIGSVAVSPDGKTMIYAVSYYSVELNKSHTVLYALDVASRRSTMLTTSTQSESTPAWIKNGQKVVFLSSESGSSQLWEMNADGTGRRQISHEADDVIDYLFSPDDTKVLLVKEVPTTTSIAPNDEDLPLASGMVINDLMYKHWDTYVKAIPHPFVARFDGNAITQSKDILEGEPYESPMLPFGGHEQFCWSPDSKQLAYTCRKKVGRDNAISTDSDIFLYDLASGTTRNLCKPEGWQQPEVEPTVSLEAQAVNKQREDCNMGYDKNPAFSPDGRYVAWSSMARDGYESDRARLCVYDLRTGSKTYVTEQFESDVNEFVWAPDSRNLYFTGVWHARTQVYVTDLQGRHRALTDDVADYAIEGITADGKQLVTKRHSMSAADEVYFVATNKKVKGTTLANVEQLTCENEAFYDQLTFGEVQERWVKTTDGKDMLCWVILPPHFDPAKKYPTLLYCEGGPQSPVSQFWSFRWNFQMMAANGYVIVAPNRRGLPGFGTEWLEAISGDYTGQCMRDYLSAIDDVCREPWVDTDRLGAVGASFGGFSIYWLAGHHDKRFKAFIAHDGIFNTQQQYMETEEMWFANWDMGKAPWYKNADGKRQQLFEESPHLFVDKWDTPILCIHGQKDFRIEYTQAESAFNAARMRGIDAQLLLFPDENHWVLKPQNGILWQRTFFRFLEKNINRK